MSKEGTGRGISTGVGTGTSKRRRVVLRIGGMHCAGCTRAIQGYLMDMDGIKGCDVNLATEKAVIEYDPAVINL
ncbi:MAG: heavy metal-associated domain-containing protein, partial [Candidatus Nitrosocaldus sp.]